MTDAEFDSLKVRLNDAIHEIVFAVQHLSQGDSDDAATCLTTAQGTLDAVAEEIVAMEER